MALATRKFRTSERPKLNTSVPQSGCAPSRGSACSYSVGAVELRERPGVAREVRGHPVDDDADARLVQRVDEEPEVVGRAEPRGRRVVRGDLVPPRAAERVLGDRQELHVGEPHVGHVGGELAGQLAVGQPGPPRAEVHLVDATSGWSAAAAPPARRASRRRPTRRPTRRRPRRWPGGVSASAAIGSAFSRQTPSGPQIENLYRVPGPTPGTNSSQTPAPPSDRIGWARPSQKLKSPTTRTPRAFGAQTANAVPVAASAARRARPQLLVPCPRRSGAGRARRASAGAGTGRPAAP